MYLYVSDLFTSGISILVRKASFYRTGILFMSGRTNVNHGNDRMVCGVGIGFLEKSCTVTSDRPHRCGVRIHICSGGVFLGSWAVL
jgi:hypothetical protein